MSPVSDETRSIEDDPWRARRQEEEERILKPYWMLRNWRRLVADYTAKFAAWTRLVEGLLATLARTSAEQRCNWRNFVLR